MELFIDGRDDRKLYIMRGIPGCGKSHRATRISQETGGVIFSADNFFGEGEEYCRNWSPNKIHLAHQDCETKAIAEMGLFNPHIIIDNTNITLRNFRVYIDCAILQNYTVYFVYPDSSWWKEKVLPFLQGKVTDQDRDVLRNEIVENLTKRNIHGVPSSTISNMLLKFQWMTKKDYFDSLEHRKSS